VISLADTLTKLGAPSRNRTTIAGLQNRSITIILIEQKFVLGRCSSDDRLDIISRPLFGGKGEIRTHTGHRMKVLHNHYATLPYRNTLGYVDSFELPKVATGESNVFLYGRGARERSEFYWLKASYFTLKFHPHMVHSPRIELGSLGLRGRTSPAKFAVDGSY
jgi:hypothetical protein